MTRNNQNRRAALRRNHRSILATSAAALLGISLLAGRAHAAPDNWTGSIDALWNTSLNWSAGIPNSSSQVSFPAGIPSTGSTITLSSGESADSLSFANNYTLSGGNLFLLGGNVDVSGTSSATINSVISSISSGFTKTGDGALILGGQNTYTANTTINGGALIVNGSIASANTFVNNGILAGSGVIGGNVVNNAFVKPGGAAGTMSVKGNYTQSSNGSLVIQVSSITNHDHLKVGGRATLNGPVFVVPTDNYKVKVGDKITFLSASTISGQFNELVAPVNEKNPLVKSSLIYTPNNVTLAYSQGSVNDLGIVLPPNVQVIAGALDKVANDPRMAKVFDHLNNLPLSGLIQACEQMSPDEISATRSVGAAQAGVQNNNIQGRTANIRAGGVSGFSAMGFHLAGSGSDYSGNMSLGAAGPSGSDGKDVKETKQVAPEETRWGVFITGAGEWVNVGDTPTARGYDVTTGGFTLGVDYKLAPNFAIGLSAGYAHTDNDLNDGGDIGVDGGKIGLYATYFPGNFYIDAAVSGGYNSYDSRRVGLVGDAYGTTEGGELDVLFGAGYTFHAGGLSIGPTGSFQYSYLGINGFTEHGSLAPLTLPGQSSESLRTAFGMKAAYDWKVGGVIVRPEVSVAWGHEYGDTAYSVDARFANGAGGTFTVTGPKIGRDSVMVGAGVAILWNDRTSTYVYYDGEFGRTNYDMSSVSGGIRIAF